MIESPLLNTVILVMLSLSLGIAVHRWYYWRALAEFCIKGWDKDLAKHQREATRGKTDG